MDQSQQHRFNSVIHVRHLLCTIIVSKTKLLFSNPFPPKTLRLWISKIQIWIWSEESTQSVDFMDSWSLFGFAPKNVKSVSGFGIPDLDFPTKTHPKLARKQLCTCSILFLYISLPLFCTTTKWNVQKLLILVAILMENMSCVFSFTFFHCRSLSPCIWLVAASISHFVTASTKFWCCSSPPPSQNLSFLFYLSL